MIPKVIHYCWFGGTDLPERDKACIESWKKTCPDYEIVRWDESNYDITANRYMLQAYEAEKWGFVPDYARLDIVFRCGGVYLDTDVELLRPLDELLCHKGFMGYAQDGYVSPGLGFGSVAGDLTIKAMRDFYDDLVFKNDDGSLNMLASPHYATECLRAFGFKIDSGFEVRDGFALLPSDYLDPMNINTGEVSLSSRTLSIHKYSASWQDERVRYQKELRRALRSKGIPDVIAFPSSRLWAFYKHEGMRATLKRMVNGKK